MKKSLMLTVAMLLVFAVFLGACSGNGNEITNSNVEGDSGGGEDTSQASGDTIDLHLITMFGGTDPATDVFKKSLEEFTQKHQNVKITEESLTSGDEFRTKVFASFSSDSEPDVTFFFTGADSRNIIDAGKVVPFDELLKADTAWADGLSPAALDQVREADGQLFAVPLTGYYEGLIVNKKLFEDHGLDLPTDWDKFETAIKTFAENGIVPLAGSLDESYYLVEHYILSAGGPEGNTAGLKDGIHESWITGLNKIKEHYELGAFPKDTHTINDSMAQNLYQQEQAAMMVNGSWALGGLSEEVMANTTVLPFPVMPGGKATYGDLVAGFGSGYFLSKKSHEDESKQETALELIKFLTSKEIVKAFAEANGGVPAANVEVEGLSSAALDGHKMVQEANSLSYPIDSQISPEAFTHIRTNLPHIAVGRKTAEEVLQEAKDIEDSK
ncbi:ABC transporter substrate-binding protein [Bacillus horti]|uniref:Raffinose/stachyose/melibiose transport system substrate-binding protein n=1 Tax=Caldalkalibacillus horti TaxID=77523 RepID=A0ABT9VV99_9BACI|nr:extracellular solute-binding protein [Bacillus horti]MDQ0164916.1 raffinose/stachyose/melibiose transport system substrate-binding protein [Bacillus horti]